MGLGLFLSSCGFDDQVLRDASSDTVDQLKLFFSLSPDNDKKKQILLYICEVNCYLAALCCQNDSDKELILERTLSSDRHLDPWNKVLTLYLFEKYSEAREYLEYHFKKRSDGYVSSFYERILSIGFFHVKDQVYFLCHCFSALIFHKTLIKLLSDYNWKCTVDEGEDYYVDFTRMISSLFKTKQYDILRTMCSVLDENEDGAFKIICRALSASYNQTVNKNNIWNLLDKKHRLHGSHRHDPLTDDEILFRMEFLGIGFYPKIYDLFSIPNIRMPENVSYYKFRLAAKYYCATGSDILFKERLDPREIYGGSDGISSLFLLRDVTVLLTERPEVAADKLLLISEFGMNAYYEAFPKNALNEKHLREFEAALKADGALLQRITDLLPRLALLKPTDKRFIYRNSILKVLFTDERFSELCGGEALPLAEADGVEEKEALGDASSASHGADASTGAGSEPSKIIPSEGITLKYGEPSPFSEKVASSLLYGESEDIDGTEPVIIHRLPEGKYNLEWQSDIKTGFQIYTPQDKTSGAVSENDPSTVVFSYQTFHREKIFTGRVKIKPQQYLVLWEGCHCIFKRTE